MSRRGKLKRQLPAARRTLVVEEEGEAETGGWTSCGGTGKISSAEVFGGMVTS